MGWKEIAAPAVTCRFSLRRSPPRLRLATLDTFRRGDSLRRLGSLRFAARRVTMRGSRSSKVRPIRELQKLTEPERRSGEAMLWRYGRKKRSRGNEVARTRTLIFRNFGKPRPAQISPRRLPPGKTADSITDVGRGAIRPKRPGATSTPRRGACSYASEMGSLLREETLAQNGCTGRQNEAPAITLCRGCQALARVNPGAPGKQARNVISRPSDAGWRILIPHVRTF